MTVRQQHRLHKIEHHVTMWLSVLSRISSYTYFTIGLETLLLVGAIVITALEWQEIAEAWTSFMEFTCKVIEITEDEEI